MFTKRESAKKMLIKDLLMQNIISVRVLGDVVFKFLGENNYGFIVVDDGTETIRASIFDSLKLNDIKIGDIVDVIGKTKDYNGEKYISAEIIRKVEDPNWEILRKIEILRERDGKTTAKETVIEKKPEETEDKIEIVEEKIKEPEKILLSCFEKQNEISMEELKKLTNLDEETVKETVKKLMLDGEIFEPRAGRLRLI